MALNVRDYVGYAALKNYLSADLPRIIYVMALILGILLILTIPVGITLLTKTY